MDEIFKTRPFKIRNADEYDLSSILNLFVVPNNGLTTPFDYENTIIKGRMGSGKTMYLRANHAYYLYNLVPSITERYSELILPVFIRLSDFQHIKSPEKIYNAIIIKIVEELTSIYLHLQNAKELAGIHLGFQNIRKEMISAHKFSESIQKLIKLGSQEYIEKITSDLGLKGSIEPSFFKLSADWKNTKYLELKHKSEPGISDIQDCYKNLLENQDGKILLLIDEAGSLNKKFFKTDNELGASYFEVLMNQLRTSSFIRTKIAIYPNTFSDILAEARYGDILMLEENIFEEEGYQKYRDKAYKLIHNYIESFSNSEISYKPEDLFELSQDSHYGDCLEQLIYGSNGNIRRLVKQFDYTMNYAFSRKNRAEKINFIHVHESFKEQGRNMESLFSDQEKDFLNTIISVCKSRNTYKFTFPNKAPVLYKYSNKSQEENIINIEQLSIGNQGNIYSFDYAYSVLKNIPTHYIADADKVNRERSLKNGRLITKVTKIKKELLEYASLPGRINGTIDFVYDKGGIITCDSGKEYFFLKTAVIENDKDKSIIGGKRVRFYPTLVQDSNIATSIEIL